MVRETQGQGFPSSALVPLGHTEHKPPSLSSTGRPPAPYSPPSRGLPPRPTQLRLIPWQDTPPTRHPRAPPDARAAGDHRRPPRASAGRLLPGCGRSLPIRRGDPDSRPLQPSQPREELPPRTVWTLGLRPRPGSGRPAPRALGAAGASSPDAPRLPLPCPSRPQPGLRGLCRTSAGRPTRRCVGLQGPRGRRTALATLSALGGLRAALPSPALAGPPCPQRLCPPRLSPALSAASAEAAAGPPRPSPALPQARASAGGRASAGSGALRAPPPGWATSGTNPRGTDGRLVVGTVC